MSLKLRENLFLLEFMIDEVFMHPGCVASELEHAPGNLCIKFKFLENPPIEICVEDYKPQCCYTPPTKKNGKSCLFPIPEVLNEVLAEQFNVNVTVFKRLSIGKKRNFKIGLTKIPLGNVFASLLEDMKEKPEETTISRTVMDIYPVVPKKLINKCCIGNITAYIRLTSLGKVLITQFQMNLQEKSVFYKVSLCPLPQ